MFFSSRLRLNPPAAAKFEDDSLFHSQGGRWITVHDEANRMLGELPESFRATYRTRFGAEATAVESWLNKHCPALIL